MLTDPHHDGSELYVRNQAPRIGDQIPIRLRVPEAFGPVRQVWVRSIRDAEPHYDGAVRLSAGNGWVWWEALVTMVNPVHQYRWLILHAGPDRDRYVWLNAEGLSLRDIPDTQDFRLVGFDPAPDWVHRAVMYQVFPDRFARSDKAAARELPDWADACDWDNTRVISRGPETPRQLFGGDLDGVLGKLDYLQSLGVTVLYLTPVFPARSNHRYDASNFSGVDELLGGNEALVRLVAAAHARGMKVIGDLTTNHSGDGHEWFRRAYKNPGAPESDFYYFSHANERYIAWFGVPTLPKFNWNSQELRRRFISGPDSTVRRWLRPPFDLDGWRIDVSNMTGRSGADDLNREVAALVRKAVAETKPDSVLLAESTSDAARDFPGDTWQGAITYSNFTRPLWQWLARDAAPVDFFGIPTAGPQRIPAEDFLAIHRDFVAGFAWRIRSQNINAIDTHDTARAATAMIDGGPLVGAGLMFTLPGIPMVFMGDEFGLEGINGEDSRTPMPWSDPSRIRTDLRPAYAELAALRRQHAALTDGSLRWLYAQGDLLVFVREHAEGSVLVAASRAPFTGVRLPAVLVGSAEPRPLWSSAPVTVSSGAGDDGDLTLAGSGPAVALWGLPGVSPEPGWEEV